MSFLLKFGRRNSLRPFNNIMQHSKTSVSRHQRLKAGKRQFSTALPQKAAAEIMTSPLTSPIPQDTPRFADLATENLIHPLLLKTIVSDLGFDHMMPVQAATLHDLLAKRIDCLAQAKTGTGKTLAFLLPAIQTLLNKKGTPGTGISLLVIAPTRELAMQIAKEADSLLKNLPQYRVQIAIGGTNKLMEQKRIYAGCDILVATPGRLIDHLGDRGFSNNFQQLDTLVLDEADRLLDMGFTDAIKQIIATLPDKIESKRQGMLFSATIAQHVQRMAHLVLSPGYKFISTIKEGDVNTHERVIQDLVVVPTFSDVAPALLGSIRHELSKVGIDAFKTIIFAPTAKLADFYSGLLEASRGLPPISTLHSRLSQSKRERITQDFRAAKNGIVVATDVIARGMDFPSVTNVFQVGVPMDRESYIHRLGRTARAGAEGRGTFIVTQSESYFPKTALRDINFHITSPDLNAKNELLAIARRLENHTVIYQAWLGYYKSFCKDMRWSAAELVQQANQFALQALGASQVPALQKTVVGKMGLKGTPGLVYADPIERPRHQTRGGEYGKFYVAK